MPGTVTSTGTQKWKSKHGLMTIPVHIKIFINITHYLWWINNILSKVIFYKSKKKLFSASGLAEGAKPQKFTILCANENSISSI